MAAMAGVLYVLVRRFQAPPRGDALPASVPTSLSEPDLQRLAEAVAAAIRGAAPSEQLSADTLMEAVRDGKAEVTSTGVLDEVIRFRLEGYDVRVDRAGKLLDLKRA